MGTKLIKYGIYDENSDIRAHVGGDSCVYVFKTKNAVSAIEDNDLREVNAYQPNYDKPTAKGVLIKPDMINDLRRLKYYSWKYWDHYSEDWDTTRKGKWAVACVKRLLKIGRFPLWVNADEVTDINLDIDGTDLLIAGNMKIQVKCDYPIGKTGNLFIQTHECNPFKKI